MTVMPSFIELPVVPPVMSPAVMPVVSAEVIIIIKVREAKTEKWGKSKARKAVAICVARIPIATPAMYFLNHAIAYLWNVDVWARQFTDQRAGRARTRG